MSIVSIGILLLIALFVVMLGIMEFGRRLCMWQMAKDPEEVKAGTGAVEAAIFALMGLLIAFTFSGAASRFDTRRVQVVEEAVTIETVWQRIDLLPKEKQQVLRDDMRAYLDMRVAAFAGARIETIKNVRLSSEVEPKCGKT